MANFAINSSLVANEIFTAFNTVTKIIAILKVRVFAPIFRIILVTKE